MISTRRKLSVQTLVIAFLVLALFDTAGAYTTLGLLTVNKVPGTLLLVKSKWKSNK